MTVLIGHAADFIAFAPLGLGVVALIAFFLWPSRRYEGSEDAESDEDASMRQTSSADSR